MSAALGGTSLIDWDTGEPNARYLVSKWDEPVRLDLTAVGGLDGAVLEQVHPGTSGVERERLTAATLELAPHATAVLTLAG